MARHLRILVLGGEWVLSICRAAPEAKSCSHSMIAHCGRWSPLQEPSLGPKPPGRTRVPVPQYQSSRVCVREITLFLLRLCSRLTCRCHSGEQGGPSSPVRISCGRKAQEARRSEQSNNPSLWKTWSFLQPCAETFTMLVRTNDARRPASPVISASVPSMSVPSHLSSGKK